MKENRFREVTRGMKKSGNFVAKKCTQLTSEACLNIKTPGMKKLVISSPKMYTANKRSVFKFDDKPLTYCIIKKIKMGVLVSTQE